MSTIIQLDLFEKVDEMTQLRDDVKFNRESISNLRKGTFARFGELAKTFITAYLNQQQQIDTLKEEIKLLKENRK